MDPVRADRDDAAPGTTSTRARAGHLSRRDVLHGALGLGAAAAASSVLGACSASSSAGDVTGNAKGTKVVEWNGWTGADGVDNLKTFLKGLTATKPDYGVQNVAYQWDTLFSKLPVAVNAGNGPNVVIMHPTEVTQFADLGVVLPFDDAISSGALSLDGLDPKAVEVCKYEGKQYGVPGDFHPMGMFYNTKHLRTAGLDAAHPPTDRETFLAWARELKGKVPKSQMVAPLYIPYNNAAQARWFWWGLLHQYGGAFTDADNTRCTVSSPEAVQSLTFLVDLYKAGLVSGEGGTQTPELAGRIGMWPIGPWVIPQYVTAKLPFTTSVMPTIGEKRATWSNSHCFTLVKRTEGKKRTASLEFIRWFSDNYADPAESQGLVPVNRKALADPTYTRSPHHRYLRPFIASVPIAVVEPRMKHYTDVFTFGKPTPLSVNLTAAVQGKKSPAAALADMQDGVNAILRS